MQKLRSTSDWCQLTPEQTRTAERWLLDEHMSYEETSARIKTDFGVEISPYSVGRYYRNRATERQIEDVAETQSLAEALADSPASTEAMRVAALKLLARSMLKMACERPNQVRELTMLAKILLHSQDNDIRLGWLKIKQDQIQAETIAAVRKELPTLGAMLLKIEHDDRSSPEGRLEKVRALLFPDSPAIAAVPTAEVPPETPIIPEKNAPACG